MSADEAALPAAGVQQLQAQEQTLLDIDKALTAFEARCDKSDPEQAALLAEMRRQSALLHQGRGDWETPAAMGRRNWNAPGAGRSGKAPATIESLRDYKAHVAAEQRRQQLLQPRSQLLLEGGATGKAAQASAD